MSDTDTHARGARQLHVDVCDYTEERSAAGGEWARRLGVCECVSVPAGAHMFLCKARVSQWRL